MTLKGISYKIDDDINTDLIISGRYKFAITDMKELAKYVFEDLDLNFSKKLIPGKTIVVAGENFGCGSSREQAPLAIKEAGIVCIIAKSFARIFYRNSFNVGVCLIEADTAKIKNNDKLIIDLGKKTLENKTSNSTIDIKPIPKIMQTLLRDKGLVAHFKKYGDLKI